MAFKEDMKCFHKKAAHGGGFY